MKRIAFGFVLLFCWCFAHAQVDSEGCVKFRTGRFVYLNDSSQTVVVKRTANKQEEKNEQTNVVTKFKIKWINSCEYELTQTWSNSKSQRKHNKGVSTIRITKLYEEGYDYSCACRDGSNKLTGTIRLLK